MPYFLSVCESQCDSDENVHCVPTSFDDNHLWQDSHNNPGTSQQVTASSSSVCAFFFVRCWFLCGKMILIKHNEQTQICSKWKTKTSKKNKLKFEVLFNLTLLKGTLLSWMMTSTDVCCFGQFLTQSTFKPFQSQNDSQQSNSNNQTTLNNSKRKRKLAKPKKISKRNDADNVQDTTRKVWAHRFFCFFVFFSLIIYLCQIAHCAFSEWFCMGGIAEF